MARVFIASSESGRPYAEEVALALAASRHESLVWWDPDVFPINQTLITSLCNLGEIADGAIIVATPDDPIMKADGSRLPVPSLNVLLEYGFFLGVLGPKRVAVVVVGSSNLPSDLGGVVSIRLPVMDNIIDRSHYRELYVPKALEGFLKQLGAASSDGRKIADLLDRMGPYRNQSARIKLKEGILREQIPFNAIGRLTNSLIDELLTKYSDSSEPRDIGYDQKTKIQSWINLAAVPTDSDDERALAAHLARFVTDLVRDDKVRPTLVAISKPGATAIVEAAARLLPYPVVSVNPLAPSRDRLVEGFCEPRDRVIILHDVVLSGRHLIDCVSALRGHRLDVHDVVTLVQHRADTANLFNLMKENGVKMHAATQFGGPATAVDPTDELTSDCFLCDVLMDSDSVPFRRLFTRGEMPSEVLLATSRFIAVCDVAPLVPGHVLLMPRQHIGSIGLMSPEDCTEMDSLRLKVAEVIRRNTGLPAIAFEHGLCDSNRRSECGIDHAHLHMLPNPGDLRSHLEENFDCREIDSLRSLPQAIGDRTEEYLLLVDYDGKHVYAEAEEPTRQFFRRAISIAVKNEHWNWHDQVILGDKMQARQTITATHEMFLNA